MKHLFLFAGLIGLSLTLTQCLTPQLEDETTALATPNLQTTSPFLDQAFLAVKDKSFGGTNLFKGNNNNSILNCDFCEPQAFSNELGSLTEAGIALGRVLFYDPRLSANNAVSCGSCHIQANAFAEPRKVSKGVIGSETPRNAMALTNLAFERGFFWRNDQKPLQELIMGPVQTHIEMGTQDIAQLSAKLAKTDYYPSLFAAAFGDSNISGDRISHALTQFVARMVSTETQFDRQATTVNSLSSLEMQGQTTFNNSCANCHSLSVGQAEQASSYDNSRPADALVSNIGLDVTDAVPANAGGFKIPGLRNIGLTAPYMHDGRFATLEEVVEHYSTGIKDNPNLDIRLRGSNNSVKHFNFSAYEKAALVAFLKTLSDEQFTNDQRFSDPFKS